jgi:hypothetical protein
LEIRKTVDVLDSLGPAGIGFTGEYSESAARGIEENLVERLLEGEKFPIRDE